MEYNDPENTLIIEVGLGYDSEDAASPSNSGDVAIELMPDIAPNHVAQVKALAREGYYDNVPFHRVIEGFMAQTGDGQRGDGTGGSDKPNVKAEFSRLPFDRGVVGMARAQNPDSANSQFFITFAESHFLNGQYTVFGRVIAGMETVDAIKRGVGQGGSVPAPRDRMIKVRVAADDA